MIKKLSVRAFLALSYGLFILVVLSATSSYWIYHQESVAEHALLTQLKERARLLATALDLEGLDFSVDTFPTTYAATNQNLQVVFLSTRFQIRNLSDFAINDKQKEVVLGLGGKALEGETVTWEDEEEITGEEALYAAAPVYDADGKVIGAVCLLLPLDAFHGSVDAARQNILELSGALAFFGLILGYVLASFLALPLARAQRLAREVAQGDYSQRLPSTGVRELAQLTSDLNQMADQLGQQNQLRKLVLANVTHELARPLGGLRLAVESLRGGALEDPETADELLADMDATLKGMGELLEDIALAAQPGHQRVVLNLIQVDPNALLKKLVARHKMRADLRGINLSFQATRDLPTIEADKKRLNQILGNLISNALKFTPSGANIAVHAEEHEANILFIVDDDGPGIPPEDMANIFEPFFQSSDKRHIRQGMGLGLTIVKQLVDAHGGTIELINRPEGGLCVIVSLPKRFSAQ